MPYIQRRAIGLIALLYLALASPQALAAASDAFFDQSLGDFPAELAAAQKAGKQGVLLMFETEACPYCRKMKEQVLGQPDVQTYYRKHFAIFPVDLLGSVPVTDFAGQSVTEKTLARAFRIRGTPTFVFIGGEGRELTRYVGATRDAREFLALGRYVVEGHWHSQDFKQFYPNTQQESRKP